MQIEGSGFRIEMATLKAVFASCADFRSRALEYMQLQFLTTTQLTGCNRLHEVEPRLARWLLMVADRVDAEKLQLTQEFLAQMLGVQRPTLTVTLGVLERACLIRHSRGTVEILSHAKLAEAACECYTITKDLLDRLYPSA